MLILDYTAAFLHAPIGDAANWHDLSEEEKKRQGVYVFMHIEALQIEHLRPKKTPAAREALVADKEGEVAYGTYSFPSVVGILDPIQGLRSPLLLVSVQDSLKTQEDPMK